MRPAPMLDYLAIGHATVDRVDGKPTLGGSVAFSSWTATRLGLKAGIVTAAGEQLDWSGYLPGVQIVRVPSAATTTFENRYQEGSRTQRLLQVADPVPASAVPSDWKNSAIVHLAPVVHEVAGGFPQLFPHSLVGLTAQGFLREWDSTGRVRQGQWAGEQALLTGSQVVVFSEEDLSGDPQFLALCRGRVPIVLLTRGDRGAVLFAEGSRHLLPAFPTREVDPTGAGDVFAAAFLIEYHRTGDAYRSTAFACCAASFAVEKPGLQGVPDRPSVEQRLALYPGLRAE